MIFVIHFKIKTTDKYVHKQEEIESDDWTTALHIFQVKYLGFKIFIHKITLSHVQKENFIEREAK
jgi:hypothetical protein